LGRGISTLGELGNFGESREDALGSAIPLLSQDSRVELVTTVLIQPSGFCTWLDTSRARLDASRD